MRALHEKGEEEEEEEESTLLLRCKNPTTNHKFLISVTGCLHKCCLSSEAKAAARFTAWGSGFSFNLLHLLFYFNLLNLFTIHCIGGWHNAHPDDFLLETSR